MNVDDLARVIYETYRKDMGQIDAKGEPLPQWDQMVNDSTKTKTTSAWMSAAETAFVTLDKFSKND